MTLINGWENFYVIIGSSAGALIGLQFVVIALIAEKPIAGGDMNTVGAFATPNRRSFRSCAIAVGDCKYAME